MFRRTALFLRSGAARVEFDARLFESDPDRQI